MPAPTWTHVGEPRHSAGTLTEMTCFARSTAWLSPSQGTSVWPAPLLRDAWVVPAWIAFELVPTKLPHYVLPLYPAVQAYFRDRQPPTLIVWGKNDKIFPADGAYPYKRDLPDVEFHLLDTGHFALEDKLDEMAPLIRGFLDRKVTR